MIQKPVVIYGMGEMGGVFARGFLKLGIPVYSVTRQISVDELVSTVPDPQLVLVAVGEAALQSTLESFPQQWKNAIGLLQNELLPGDWAKHELDPTVISVWFEKKKGMDAKVLISSPCYGQSADLLVDALAAIDIPANKVASASDMEYELVRKNVYILTTNISGLETGGNVEQLWGQHKDVALAVIDDVIEIQDYLTGSQQDKDRLIKGFEEGVAGDPAHMCMGRSAPARLQRALGIADEAGLAVPKMRAISEKL